MIVVSDSGPIIHLSFVGQLELLPALFGEVVIPEKVFREVVEDGNGLPGSSELAQASWIRVEAVSQERPELKLIGHLDPGEQEAIALALERGANRLIVDDLPARRAAR